MAEKSFPAQFVQDVKEMFEKPAKGNPNAGVPGSLQPAPGKCGCHPGGIHPTVDVTEAEQRDDVKLVAIPTKVENLVDVRVVPSKRGTMETFYPAATAAALSAGNGIIQGADPRIRRIVIAVSVQSCWLGTQEALKSLSAGNAVGGAGMFLAPVGTYTWEGIHEDLWAMAATAGSIVSVRREYWTDI
jgi:hypothetical protein